MRIFGHVVSAVQSLVIGMVGLLSGCGSCPATIEDLATIDRAQVSPVDFTKLRIGGGSGWTVPDQEFANQLADVIHGLQTQNPQYHKPFVIRVEGVPEDAIVHGSPAPARYSIRYKISDRCPLYVLPISDGGGYNLLQFGSHFISHGVIQPDVWRELKEQLEARSN